MKTEDRLQIEGFEAANTSGSGTGGNGAHANHAVMPDIERPRILRVGASTKTARRAETPTDPSLRLLERVHEDVAELKQGLLELSGSVPSGDSKGATGTLDAIEVQLKTISQSVEFTEAYVSVGLATRIGEMLREETAVALKSAQATLRMRRRLRIALLLVATLAGLLAAEIAGDHVGTAATNIASQFDGVISRASSLLRELRQMAN